jgi:hypothetical protein
MTVNLGRRVRLRGRSRRRVAGAESREGLSCGLREGGERGWGGAERRRSAGAGTVGEDGLHGAGILHGRDGVVQETTSTRTKKINQELFFPLYTILS